MKFHTERTKYLFDNIKNGDFLASYRKPWYFLFSQLVKVVTGNKLGHIAAIFDVERGDNIIRFKLGEQTISEGKKITEYCITRSFDKLYMIDSRFRNKNIDTYLLANRHILSSDQNIELGKYWREKEDYSLAELSFTVNWFYKIFGKKEKIYDNNCSTAARQSMIRVGIQDSKFDDKVPNPTEFAKFSFIKSIVKIKAGKNG